jgi:hypothetical protein
MPPARFATVCCVQLFAAEHTYCCWPTAAPETKADWPTEQVEGREAVVA